MNLSTQLSLIGRLKSGGQPADWERFYKKYSGVITSFARRQGCDDHTALDVLQECMMVVMRKLPAFEYDVSKGRFRNWLLTIVVHKVREARRRSHIDRLVSLDANSDESASLLDRLPGVEDSTQAELESRWRQAIIEDALRRVLDDPRTNPQTVAVFREVALEGRPVDEVAARHGLKANAVYQIKNRLLTRLQAIVAEMERGSMNLSLSTDR